MLSGRTGRDGLPSVDADSKTRCLADGACLEEFPRLFFWDESLGYLLDKLFLPRGGGSCVPVIRLFGRHVSTSTSTGFCFSAHLSRARDCSSTFSISGSPSSPTVSWASAIAWLMSSALMVGCMRECILHELRRLQRNQQSRTAFPVLADKKINPALSSSAASLLPCSMSKSYMRGSACFPIQVFQAHLSVVCFLIA